MLVLPDSFEKRKKNVSRSIRMKTKRRKKEIEKQEEKEKEGVRTVRDAKRGTDRG